MTEKAKQVQKDSPAEPLSELEDVEHDGKETWWQVLGGFLVLFVIWGPPISFGAFQDFYTLEYLPNYPASTISWIGTFQGAWLVAVGLVSGPLYNLGYWLPLYAVGSFMCVFGMMMLSISTEYYQVFLSRGVCVQIGCGLLYIPVLTLIRTAFKQQRALAIGVITSGIALGGISHTIIYLKLQPTMGFGWMVRAIAFVSLTAFVAGAPADPAARFTSNRLRSHAVRQGCFDRCALPTLHTQPVLCVPRVPRASFLHSHLC